jgi:hypothetical protein
MKNWCWHDWTKWEQYIENGRMQRHPFAQEMLPYTREKQRRYCKKCNLKQERNV